ncbi:hypothetical protein ACGMNB_09775 [Shewanella oncorhynchi]|uniref:hypothetical protein n=1 Tax=Shewanella oncorhynchi TaxID=2726434 RepID=UPI0010405548
MTARQKQAGQALVESAIGLTYVAVPLLLLLPFMAKLTGIQHRVEQGSHYTAWERTVWKESTPSRLPNRTDLFLAKKTEIELAKQIPWRLYQQDGVKLTSSSKLAWDWTKQVHPMLKHQLKQDGTQQVAIKSHNGPPKNNNELDRLTQENRGERLPGNVGNAVNQAIGLLSYTGFDLETDQFYRTKVSHKIENFYLAPFDKLDLNVQGNNALLASGWNAAGPNHIKNLVERLVLTKTMDMGVIQVAQKALAIIPFGKELSPSKLKFGYVEPNILPQNRLCTYGTANCGG